MKKIFTILGIAALCFAACSRAIDLQDSDLEYTASESAEDIAATSGYYTISKVLQFSDENPDGVDIKPYFDWFDSFSVELKNEEGKMLISGITIDNGNIPHDRYGFSLPASETECYFDDSQTPYCIRRKADDVQLVVYNGANLYLDFTLSDKGISYRYVLNPTKKQED